MDWSSDLRDLIETRRELHAHPEAGWTEFWTTAYVASSLEDIGYSVSVGKDVIDQSAIMGRPDDVDEHIERALSQGADPLWIDKMGGYTGAMAVLDTRRPGPVVAFRFDIDCVETIEAEGEDHLPSREGFRSINPGCMHSCAHDGHTAMGIALARRVMSMKDRLCGVVKLLFQPAEEGVRGGYAMTQKGLLDDVDLFVAAHFGMGVPTGTVISGTRGFLCTTKLDVDFKGMGSHAGGEPHKGKNALLAAATAALNLHAIAPHSGGVTRLNVGVLNAGEGRNVVPPRASMKIETRGETNEIASYVYDRAETVIRSSAEMYGVKWETKKVGEAVTSSSDAELMATVAGLASEIEEVDKVGDIVDMGGSDDATWMMNRVQQRGGKATYVIIGSDIAAGHHNDYFDFDERSMLIGLKLLVGVVAKAAGVV
ncbi:amidohydrolase [Dethiosulfovibrio salsuginis]|uniref:Aminobenzoyl-glutamate utilization protein A n=1 Tax=Dethiosulfovibrio salsuginis TaxID=561720 RepID=A0A1X7KKE8_9BACT|nr:amidohydrolase [Dethiosulfovibrio salsuginis]SMG41609.1 aminobenzoyl-glutamate utilization protein A [Dethiosulfovibrio salsuginis]